MYIISFVLVDNRVDIKNNYNYLEEKIEKIYRLIQPKNNSDLTL